MRPERPATEVESGPSRAGNGPRVLACWAMNQMHRSPLLPVSIRVMGVLLGLAPMVAAGFKIPLRDRDTTIPVADCDTIPVAYKIPLVKKDIAPMDKATRCDLVKWRHRARFGSYEVMVSDSLKDDRLDWDISVAVKSPEAGNPLRCVCLNADTRGMQTLLEFEGSALPWLEDIDKDGDPEVILWRSFPTVDWAPSEYGFTDGLMGWVYRFENGKRLVLDKDASKRLAARLVKAYRKPVSDEDLQEIREEAARRLERFIKGACLPREL